MPKGGFVKGKVVAFDGGGGEESGRGDAVGAVGSAHLAAEGFPSGDRLFDGPPARIRGGPIEQEELVGLVAVGMGAPTLLERPDPAGCEEGSRPDQILLGFEAVGERIQVGEGDAGGAVSFEDIGHEEQVVATGVGEFEQEFADGEDDGKMGGAAGGCVAERNEELPDGVGVGEVVAHGTAKPGDGLVPTAFRGGLSTGPSQRPGLDVVEQTDADGLGETRWRGVPLLRQQDGDAEQDHHHGGDGEEEEGLVDEMADEGIGGVDLIPELADGGPPTTGRFGGVGVVVVVHGKGG